MAARTHTRPRVLIERIERIRRNPRSVEIDSIVDALEASARFSEAASRFVEQALRNEPGGNVPSPLRAAMKRASMDLTRALAAVRRAPSDSYLLHRHPYDGSGVVREGGEGGEGDNG